MLRDVLKNFFLISDKLSYEYLVFKQIMYKFWYSSEYGKKSVSELNWNKR